MASDLFIKFDKINGESRDRKMINYCDVLSWSWGIEQTASFGRTAGRGTGRAEFRDFAVTKNIDSASTRIANACATGVHMAKIEFVARKAGGQQMDYLKYVFEGCIITGYEIGGNGGSPIPIETISVNYAKVKMSYFTQDGKGMGAAAGDFSYDLAANTSA